MSNKTVAASSNREQLNAPYEAIKDLHEQGQKQMERVNRILRESKDAVAAKNAAAQRG